MKTLKKILVVDDTPANLEAAKACFSQNKDLEFIYATDRATAEGLLKKCDALITDRSIPIKEGEKTEDYEGGFTEMKLMGNGYALLIEATALNIPALMVSSHGDITLAGVIKDVEAAQKISSEMKEHAPYSDENFELAMWAHLNSERVPGFQGMSKENSETWKLALTKLTEEFKLNEKPTELPKIKLQ